MYEALKELLKHESPNDWPWSQKLWEKAQKALSKADGRWE